MRRRPLEKNHGCQMATRLVFVDCETKDTKPEDPGCEYHRLWFGVANTGTLRKRGGELRYGAKQSITFYSVDQFWDWLQANTRKNETTWIYAHNAGFDMTALALWDQLRANRFKISKPMKKRGKKDRPGRLGGLLLLDDPPTIIGLEDERGARYVVCDTLNYWRTSLKALGKSVGLEKLEMPSEDPDLNTWIKYCRRDVEIIEHAVLQLMTWWKDQNLGNWKWTGPSLAMSAFRHRFMTHEIEYHDEWDVREIERHAYYGGQLEAYALGEIAGPVYQYDVNSLYPHVMRQNLFPTHLAGWSTTPYWREGPPKFEPSRSIAEVELNTPVDTFPCKHKGESFYCNGVGVTWLAGPELQFAFDRGLVTRWGRYASYDVAPIFTEYVEYFHELKEQYAAAGKDVQRTFTKLLLNSLYGKFGQKGARWEPNPSRIPMDDFGIFYEVQWPSKTRIKCLGIWNVVLDWVGDQETFNAFPAIAAFVTAYARQHMRNLRSIAGRGNYFYQSTDSLIVNAEGKRRLGVAGELDGDQLGGLKLEQEGESAWIGGLHFYRVGEKLVEGSKKASAETTGLYTWRELQFDSLRTVLELGGPPEVRVRQVEKERSRQYRKGTPSESGSVEPFDLPQLCGETGEDL